MEAMDGASTSSEELAVALSPTEFGSVVTAVTNAFGDPTRRAIYLWVMDRPDGATAAAVASNFSLHTNVARHHLDKLASGGYLQVGTERPAGGAGRPSKVFRASAPKIDLGFPVRHDEIIIRLLARALGELGEERSAELAEDVGNEFGQTLAESMGQSGTHQGSVRAAVMAVADALASHGFGAQVDADASQISVDHCPFGELATQNPVICAVERGMMKGMLDHLRGTSTSVAMRRSRVHGADECVTDIGA